MTLNLNIFFGLFLCTDWNIEIFPRTKLSMTFFFLNTGGPVKRNVRLIFSETLYFFNIGHMRWYNLKVSI